MLFGSLVGGKAYALSARRPLSLPEQAFTAAQGLVGATIGALLSLPTLQRLASDAGSILAATVGTLVISLLAGLALSTRRGV